MVLERAVNGAADALITHNINAFKEASVAFRLRVVKPADFFARTQHTRISAMSTFALRLPESLHEHTKNSPSRIKLRLTNSSMSPSRKKSLRWKPQHFLSIAQRAATERHSSRFWPKCEMSHQRLAMNYKGARSQSAISE